MCLTSITKEPWGCFYFIYRSFDMSVEISNRPHSGHHILRPVPVLFEFLNCLFYPASPVLNVSSWLYGPRSHATAFVLDALSSTLIIYVLSCFCSLSSPICHVLATFFCLPFVLRRVAVPELEREPTGAETFGRSRSWSRYTKVSAPAPGSGSRANQSSVLNLNSY